MNKLQQQTTAAGIPVPDNQTSLTAGERGPTLLQDHFLLEKLAHFNRERIPERVVHAKAAGAHGTFTVTNDITKYTKASIFAKVGKQTSMIGRFSTVAGEKGSADTVRDVRGFALKFYTDEGNWDLVGNNTPVSFIRKSAIRRPIPAPIRCSGISGRKCRRRCIKLRFCFRIAAFRVAFRT